MILNQAIRETIRILAEKDLCPEPADYDLAIEEGWECAVTRRRQDPEEWPMVKDHATVVSPN